MMMMMIIHKNVEIEYVQLVYVGLTQAHPNYTVYLYIYHYTFLGQAFDDHYLMMNAHGCINTATE